MAWCRPGPSHYLNQWWNIINWTLRNKLHRNFNKILIFSFKKMCFQVSSAKWQPFCLSLTVLTDLSSRSCVMASASLIESVIDCCICSFWWFRSDCNVSTYTGGIYMKQVGKDLIGLVDWWPLLESLSWYLLICVKSPPFIWRLGAHRFRLQVPNLEVSYSDQL